jgi:hypothetical protein
MDARLPAAVLAATVALAACGGGGRDAAGPRACPTPVAAADTGSLPKRVPLERWGTITEVSERGGFVGAEAIGEGKIVELYPEMVRTMTGNGYSFLGGDNEGFEAELSFADGRRRLTTFTLRTDRCDRVIVRTLVETTKEHG